MAKRSRETFSSFAAEQLSNETSSDVDPDRVSKYKLVEGSPPAPKPTVMRCSLPPHKEALEFQFHEDYEVHYLKEHTNRCSSCGKNFPTAHFLELHIEENHNALRETLQAKGERTYACFVEDCERKCSTPQKRRLHLIDKHGFPKFYNFRVVDTGIDKATSLLREGQKRRVSLSNATNQPIGHRWRASSQIQASMQINNVPAIAERPQAVTEPHLVSTNDSAHSRPPDPALSDKSAHASVASDNIGDLERSMSALRFVPTSVMLKNSKKS